MSYVEAECCGGSNDCNGGNMCCGCGSCNMFCCNCDHGCNRDYWNGYLSKKYPNYKGPYGPGTCWHRKKRDIVNTSRNVSLAAGLLFKKVDIDGNNAITIGEANSYLTNKTRVKKSTTFSIDHELIRMDRNRDGIISPGEFDVSLKF